MAISAQKRLYYMADQSLVSPGRKSACNHLLNDLCNKEWINASVSVWFSIYFASHLSCWQAEAGLEFYNLNSLPEMPLPIAWVALWLRSQDPKELGCLMPNLAATLEIPWSILPKIVKQAPSVLLGWVTPTGRVAHTVRNRVLCNISPNFACSEFWLT